MNLRLSHAVFLVLTFLLVAASTASAALETYEFSGNVDVIDTQNMLGNGTVAYSLPLAGSFTVDTEGVGDDYAVTQFSLAIGDYTFSDPGGVVNWTQQETTGQIGGHGLSSNLEGILSPLKYNYNVWIWAYGATPGDNSQLDYARIDVEAEQAGPGAWRFTFNERFDEFKITESPVPVPGALWLLASGLMGLAGIQRKQKHS